MSGPRACALLLGGLVLAAALQSPTARAAVPVRVVCIGDSITYRNFPAWEYPTYVQEALGSDYEVTNCGHNGALLTKQSARAGDYYAETQEYESCRQMVPNPDVVTVMLGTNDSGYWQAAQTSYDSEYTELVAALKQSSPKLKVVAATSPAAVANWNDLISGTVIRDQIAPRVRTLAEQQGYFLADVQAATASWLTSADLTSYDASKFADAGVHPNEAGARQIADVFVLAIRAATAPEPVGGAGGAAAGGASAGGASASGGGGASAGGASGGAGGRAAGGVGGAPSGGSDAGTSPTSGSPGVAGAVANAAGGGDAASLTTASADSSCGVARGAGGGAIAISLWIAALSMHRRRATGCRRRVSSAG